jgi:DNA-binding SARP family transcriptional activator/predicted ATPase
VSRLALHLLGSLRVEVDGAPTKLGRRKAVALLAYLAVTGESHPRDSLVNLLWPELDSTRGRAALRRTLYSLSQTQGGAWLDVDRDDVALALSPAPSSDSQPTLWVDVTQFRQLLAQCQTHGHAATQVCPACVPLLTEAVDLVRGEFLSGFSLKDSLNFDDWQLFQAEALRRELSGALEGLVDWLSSDRQFELAAGYARRKLALDPFDEKVHRQLMRLYAWSGHRSAALRQYEECARILEEQLAVPPQDATAELYRAIQAGRPPAPPEKAVPPEAREDPHELPPFLMREVPVERPVFVARDQELAYLNRQLQATLAGQGKVVFITGEAGSGKTALLHEFARQALETHHDLVVAIGNCNAYTGLGDPYLPFREILELLTGDVEARWAAGAITAEHAQRLWNTLPYAARALAEAGPDLVGTFISRGTLLRRARAFASAGADWVAHLDTVVDRKPAAPGMPSPQQSDLFEQFTRVLQGLAQHSPLVLLVDDLQWADLGSISLLFHLGRQLLANKILVVGAYRSEEVTIGREGERHPLQPVINEFGREFGDITRDLGQAESRDFIEAFLDSEPNRLAIDFRNMLYQRTRGHPLFTAELLRGLQERGDLVRDPAGRWIEGQEINWETLPARIESVIAERLGRLAQPLQAALRVASVEGEVFTAEVIARVLGTASREIVSQLSSELDRRHRLIRAEALEHWGPRRVSRYRFRNFLFQQYLYDSLDQVERAYLHEDVGQALEMFYADQKGESEAIAPQLAWHFEEAGIAEKTLHYLHQAGDRAVRLSAYQEGRAHLAKALDLLLSLPASDAENLRMQRAQQELALQLSLGTAWMGDIPGPEWENAFIRARELCQRTGQTEQLCRVLGELSVTHYVRAEHLIARQLGEEALTLARQAGNPLLLALGQWNLGFISFSLGEYATARDHLEQVIAVYNPDQHHRTFIDFRGSDAGLSALAYDACCLWCLGYPDQAYERAQEALSLARELDHAFTLSDVVCFGGCVLNSMRRDAQALKDSAEQLVRLSKGMGFSSFGGTGTCYWGQALAWLGQTQIGIAHIQEGLATRQAIGARCHLAGILAALAQAEAQAGQPDKGLATLAKAIDTIEQTDEHHWEAEIHRLKGELLLLPGQHVEAEARSHQAERCFQYAIDVARHQNAKSWELRATTSLARLWQQQGYLDKARAVLAEIYDWFTEGFDTPDSQEADALITELG